MNKIIFALLGLTLASNAHAKKLNCQGDDIILAECQIESMTGDLAANKLYVAAQQEAIARMTPSEESLMNGVKILKAAACGKTFLSLKKSSSEIVAGSLCTIQLQFSDSVQNRKIRVAVKAYVRNEYEMYFPTIRSITLIDTHEGQ